MNTRRRGILVKWAAGIAGILFVGGGNVLGMMIRQILYDAGITWEMAVSAYWCVCAAVWASGVALSAVTYVLGAVLERMEEMEMRLFSLDTAVRNLNIGKKK